MRPQVYGPDFFATIRAGSQASAAVVAPIVYNAFQRPQRVIDVGCGEGHWALAFEALGCDVLGVDGPSTRSELGSKFIPRDLEQPLEIPGEFDIAVSLEVAEHLTPGRAAGFVADLCGLAPVVVFSAAIPGQGGTRHLNEQWPGYWAELFEGEGYSVSGALRWAIWNDDRVENWYRQNLLVCARPGYHPPELFGMGVLAEPLAVVHPVLFDHVRASR